jgi:hypothetical protein
MPDRPAHRYHPQDNTRIASFGLPLAQDFVCCLDRTNQNIQADEDQIDVGDRDRDLAGDYESTVEHMIECFEKREISLFPLFTYDYLVETHIFFGPFVITKDTKIKLPQAP